MPDTASAPVAAWAGATEAAPRAVPQKFPWARLLPALGPLLLFVLWDAVVRFGFIKPILLPTPFDTLIALVTGLAGGTLLLDFAVTVKRTLEAFLIAAAIGVPLGVLLGSNERAYRSVEFHRLFPLDAVVRADSAVPADIRRDRRQQGRDCRIRRVADCAFQ